MGRISGGLVFGVWMVFVLLVAVFGVVLNVPLVRDNSGTIYIRANGLVEGTDKIASADNITYTFTDNIYDEIVVERSNIIIDGNGYILQGSRVEYSKGIDLTGISNATIENMTITGFYRGIYLSYSNYNSISGNNITANNDQGIYFVDSSNNTVSGNDLSNHGQEGILLDNSSNNTLIHNNITSKVWVGFPGITLTNSHNNNLNDNIVSSYTKGIKLWYSSNNTLGENSVSNNYDFGIYLFYSNNNILSGNNVSNNYREGIVLYLSSDNTLVNNTASNNLINFRVEGSQFSDFNNYVDTSNTVDGKPIYYLISVINADYGMETNAGTIYLINCDNITIRDVTLTKNRFGVFLWNTTNSKIRNITATNNVNGIWIERSSNNSFVENIVSLNNYYGGIRLYASSNNTFCGNTVFSNSDYGIYLEYSSNNKIFHNNFDNGYQVYCYGSANIWDDGYPSSGNYWSNYTGVDLHSGSNQDETGSDGVGDTPYEIDADSLDRYPLIGPFTMFDVGIWNGVAYNVDVVSNSTVSDFQLNVAEKTVSFNVTGVEGFAGFCRVTVPNLIVEELWQGNFTVLLNGEPYPFRNWTDTTNTYIYINYTHSEHQITIIPEFPSAIILPLFMILSAVALVFAKKKAAQEN